MRAYTGLVHARDSVQAQKHGHWDRHRLWDRHRVTGHLLGKGYVIAVRVRVIQILAATNRQSVSATTLALLDPRAERADRHDTVMPNPTLKLMYSK